ncbi:hypothetical protein HPB50_011117 [Hyalomma asiaticum]|uniref:Uncharacterized protein n=1 Tax=Hyalomma asiaticum TaxID=266040 RepID=A0ACB7SDN0_HYAAI|nr:hypothetical protein HPB50_011117 [Hyalomma asiaticum]
MISGSAVALLAVFTQIDHASRGLGTSIIAGRCRRGQRVKAREEAAQAHPRDPEKRRHFGEYFTLVPEMRLGDGNYLFEYFRMSIERFDRLLPLVGPLIQPMRITCNTLSAGEKLAFTLRGSDDPVLPSPELQLPLPRNSAERSSLRVSQNPRLWSAKIPENETGSQEAVFEGVAKLEPELHKAQQATANLPLEGKEPPTTPGAGLAVDPEEDILLRTIRLVVEVLQKQRQGFNMLRAELEGRVTPRH